ncbi:MAG: hypothetical protein AAF483_08975 [Planctomycetota bacterium]
MTIGTDAHDDTNDSTIITVEKPGEVNIRNGGIAAQARRVSLCAFNILLARSTSEFSQRIQFETPALPIFTHWRFVLVSLFA